MKRRLKAPSRPVIRLRVPAKINLGLEIHGRREDGYHEIDTVMQAISLYDDLEARPLDEVACRIACDDPGVPTGEGNLCHAAWRELRRIAPDRVGGVEFILTKRIPSGAGLGGGSADAAAALVALDRLHGLRLGRAGLSDIAARIGSDVAFFLYSGAARCTGRGEIIQPIAGGLRARDLIVVCPEFVSSTPKAYELITPYDYEVTKLPECMAAHIAEGDIAWVEKNLFSVFDRVLTKRAARYAELKQAMRDAGAGACLISGSGSACFGFATGPRAALAACKQLHERYPRTFVVRTLRSGLRALSVSNLAK